MRGRCTDMVCTTKWVSVILPTEVCVSNSIWSTIWKGPRTWARMPPRFARNSTHAWAKLLGNRRRNFIPRVFLEAPSSRSWKPSLVHWATRWSAQLIEINIVEQADNWPDEELGECPVCGGPARKAPDQPRVLMTTRGDVGWKQRVANCPRCRRAFFPQNQALGLDHCGFSPRVQQKIVHAGVNGVSYQQASRDLVELSDLNVALKPVERMVKKIGQERVDQRDVAVESHQRLPLMAKDAIGNPKRSCPKVAMVSVDGGRLQIRSESSEPKQDSHWRESKVAVLETYQSGVHQADPDPHVPRCFLDLT